MAERNYHWLILHCVVRKLGYLQNVVTIFWKFVTNSELSRFFCFFRHGTSTVTSVVI